MNVRDIGKEKTILVAIGVAARPVASCGRRIETPTRRNSAINATERDGSRYRLLLLLRAERTIHIGRLGTFRFPAGYYVYVGSALRGLGARLDRHLRREKKLHWHIDYFLQHAQVIGVKICGSEETECGLAQKSLSLPGALVPVRGFGASDCRCGGHLVYLGNELPFECTERL